MQRGPSRGTRSTHLRRAWAESRAASRTKLEPSRPVAKIPRGSGRGIGVSGWGAAPGRTRPPSVGLGSSAGFPPLRRPGRPGRGGQHRQSASRPADGHRPGRRQGPASCRLSHASRRAAPGQPWASAEVLCRVQRFHKGTVARLRAGLASFGILSGDTPSLVCDGPLVRRSGHQTGKGATNNKACGATFLEPSQARGRCDETAKVPAPRLGSQGPQVLSRDSTGANGAGQQWTGRLGNITPPEGRSTPRSSAPVAQEVSNWEQRSRSPRPPGRESMFCT
jgi:hypothetical protein